MTLQTQSAPATAAAGATEPIWFASYPPGIPKTIDAGRLFVALGAAA